MTSNQTIKRIFTVLKPWAITLGVVLLLRYTGLLAGITAATNTALMQTGVHDVTLDESVVADFNYDFAIKQLDGKTISMEELKGKVIFLNLWATWCGPCRAEMPGIQTLHDDVTNSDIAFVMLSLDRPGSEKKINSYIESNEFTFPVYTPAGPLPDQLQVPSIPTTFIINKDGKVVQKKIGMTNFNTSQFKKYLKELAAK